MGIIRAIGGAIGGGLADQWLEVYEPDDMSDKTVFTSGVPVRRDDARGQNKKGTANTISNGSIVHVYPNQFMMLVDGGKIVDYTAEEGYYKVDNSSMPSLFNGQFGASLSEAFGRIKFGGVPSGQQKVFFINLQEIKGIKFGTRTPVNYFDSYYNAELFLRAHGTYSIKIVNPILFYQEAIPRNADRVQIDDINEQYLSEFLSALQSSLNQMSADGERISFVPSKGRELSKYMSTTLDEEWTQMRGMQVQAVGISSISFTEESQELLNMRSKGAMLSDPNVREGYVQGSIARGMEAAGSNSGGAMQGFMGMGLGMNSGGNFMGAASASNQQQMAAQQSQQQAAPAAPAPAADTWSCECGTAGNAGKFCSQCGKPKPAPAAPEGTWNCECGNNNSGKFCSQCGKPKPGYKCNKCGFDLGSLGTLPKFCPECGDVVDEADKV